MNTSDILSIIAIVVSVLGFVITLGLDKQLYGPDFRIVAFSIPKGIEIQLENVGPRIRKVIGITYTLDTIKRKKDIATYTDNLSSLFYHIPCLTRGESRMKHESLFPDSKHKLLKTTFEKQDQLIEAWEIVGKLTVKVEFKGLFLKHSIIKSLKNDYDTFLDALIDENGNMRTLLAYKETVNKE